MERIVTTIMLYSFNLIPDFVITTFIIPAMRQMLNFIQSSYFKDFMLIILKFGLIVMATSFVQWILVKAYVTYCVTMSWVGAITNIFSLGSPFCQFINYTQYELSKHYITIWASAGIASVAWFISKIKS